MRRAKNWTLGERSVQKLVGVGSGMVHKQDRGGKSVCNSIYLTPAQPFLVGRAERTTPSASGREGGFFLGGVWAFPLTPLRCWDRLAFQASALLSCPTQTLGAIRCTLLPLYRVVVHSSKITTTGCPAITSCKHTAPLCLLCSATS